MMIRGKVIHKVCITSRSRDWDITRENSSLLHTVISWSRKYLSSVGVQRHLTSHSTHSWHSKPSHHLHSSAAAQKKLWNQLKLTRASEHHWCHSCCRSSWAMTWSHSDCFAVTRKNSWLAMSQSHRSSSSACWVPLDCWRHSDCSVLSFVFVKFVRHLAAKAMRLEQLLVLEVVRRPAMCCYLASSQSAVSHSTGDAAANVDLGWLWSCCFEILKANCLYCSDCWSFDASASRHRLLLISVWLNGLWEKHC